MSGPYPSWRKIVAEHPDWTDDERKMFFAAHLGQLLGSGKLPVRVKRQKFLGFIPYVDEPTVEAEYARLNKIAAANLQQLLALPVTQARIPHMSVKTTKQAAEAFPIDAADQGAIASAGLPLATAGALGLGLGGAALGGGVGAITGATRDLDPGEERGAATIRSAGTGAATGMGAALGTALGGMVGGQFGPRGAGYGMGIGAGAGAILMYLLSRRKSKRPSPRSLA